MGKIIARNKKVFGVGINDYHEKAYKALYCYTISIDD